MKTDQAANRFSRRQFLTTAALAVAAPTILPSSVLGQVGKPVPSNRDAPYHLAGSPFGNRGYSRFGNLRYG